MISCGGVEGGAWLRSDITIEQLVLAIGSRRQPEGGQEQLEHTTYGAVGCGAVAVAEFLAVEWTALRLEAAARAFDVVNDRFDCDCARALKALLAWWLPDRSILCVCGGVEMVSRGKKKRRLEQDCTSGAV